MRKHLADSENEPATLYETHKPLFFTKSATSNRATYIT